jgi:thiol-disulfide isomerase/thioredoxin
MNRPWLGRLLDRLTGARSTTDDADGFLAPQPYMLEGQVTLDELLAFRAWGEVLAEPYAPATQAVEDIAARLAGAELWVFLATWCGDCKRELPRLLHVLASAGWPDERLRLVGVDWDKRDPDGLVETWCVERVPTLIIAREGREIGRLVERPRQSLEQDLAALLGA